MEVGDIYFMNLMFFSAPLSVLSTERSGELKQRERGEEVRERERERVNKKTMQLFDELICQVKVNRVMIL